MRSLVETNRCDQIFCCGLLKNRVSESGASVPVRMAARTGKLTLVREIIG